MATLLAAVEATLLGKYLAELETLASANRHGQQRSLQQPLSVPDFTRQVERRLRDAGHAEAPIPWCRLGRLPVPPASPDERHRFMLHGAMGDQAAGAPPGGCRTSR